MSRSLPAFVFLPLLLHFVAVLLAIMMSASAVASLPTTSSDNSKNSAYVPDANRNSHDSFSDAKLEYQIETETEIGSDSVTTDETPKQFLGSSVVTSVSVVMNPKNISKSLDSLKLFNPEKYEFYTLNKNGEVIKKTMTLNEIRRVVAMDNGLSAELRDNQNSYELYEEEKINEVMEKLKSILQEETNAYENDQQRNASKLNELVSTFEATTVVPWADSFPEQRTTVSASDSSDPAMESESASSSSAATVVATTAAFKSQTTLKATTVPAETSAATTVTATVAASTAEDTIAPTSFSRPVTTISPVSNEESAPHHSTFSYYVPVSLIHPSALTTTSSPALPVEQKTISDPPTTEFSPVEETDVATENVNLANEDSIRSELTTAQAERELEQEPEPEPQLELISQSQPENDQTRKSEVQSETKTAESSTEAVFASEQHDELQMEAENEKEVDLDPHKEIHVEQQKHEQEQEREREQQIFDAHLVSGLQIDQLAETENHKNEQLPSDEQNLSGEGATTDSSALLIETTDATTVEDNRTSKPYATDAFELDDIVSQVIEQINNDAATTVVSELSSTTLASAAASPPSFEPVAESEHESASGQSVGYDTFSTPQETATAAPEIDGDSVAAEVASEPAAESPVDKENELTEAETSEDEPEPVEQLSLSSSSSPPLQLPSLPSSPSSPSSTMWQLISKTDHLQKKRIENFSPSKSSDLGLESTLEKMDNNKKDFIKLCNELAFRYWYSIMSTMKNPNLARSVVMSPFAITSTLSMIFLAARGQTTTEMNRILKLDGAFTFNPHYLFKTVTDSLQINHRDGILNSALVRELFSDRAHGELLNFYKDRVKFFYDGYVEEVDFTAISDIIRRRTNLFIKTRVRDSALEYIYSNTITLRAPLAAFTATIFQTDCSDASISGRDGEMYFIVLPSMRQRRLIQIPAVVHKSNFLLGYEPQLDTIVASVQHSDASNISTVFIMPSRQSLLSSKFGPIDDLLNLEKQLIEDPSVYNLLLRTLAKRDSMEIQLPRFSHRSIINSTEVLWKMGFNELLTKNRANLEGLGSVNEQLYLSDLMQVNSFTNCANQFDELHREDDAAVSDRQKKDSDQITRLRFNRPFLYFVRHNPTGLIVHMGRFNPRLVV